MLSRNYSRSSAYYTPSFIIRSILRGIDHLLRVNWHKNDGIFTDTVEFLDPSAGILKFSQEMIRFAHEQLFQPQFNKWLYEHFIPYNFAFDIDQGAIRTGLEQLYSYVNEIIEQDHSTAANSLSANISSSDINSSSDIDSSKPLNPTLAEEYFHRNRVKYQCNLPKFHVYQRNPLSDPENSLINGTLLPQKENSLLIIYGNPPYAVSSQSKSSWITELVNDYKTNLHQQGTKRLKGLKGIQDDYVKFVRYCQWLTVDQGQPGIVALVLNNYFLDGDIFRGMRSSLLESFNTIYIIDLFGDPKKGVPIPTSSLEMPSSVNDGGQNEERDQNIFEIQTGICLFFGVSKISKNSKKRIKKPAEIYYCGCYGSISRKTAFCNRQFKDLPFEKVEMQPDFAFRPISAEEKRIQQEYDKFCYMPEIFQANIIGIQSLHDTLITHPDREQLIHILTSFYDGTYDRIIITDTKGQQWVKSNGVVYHDARDWKIADGKKGSLERAINSIQQWQWRGFDRWWVAYDKYLMTKGSSSYRLMQFMYPWQNNVAIVVSRKSRKATGGSSVLATNILAESHCVEGGFGIGDYVFPLKISLLNSRKNHWDSPLTVDSYNFTPHIWDYFSPSETPSPETLFAYIYAVLWTPIYRNRYQQLLKKDFPRIPIPKDSKLLQEFAKYGSTLLSLHTFEFSDPQISTVIKTKYPVSENRKPIIIFPKFEPQESRIYFNHKSPSESFWIGGISQAVWEFEIGGHKQIQQFLRHRTVQSSISSAQKYSQQAKPFKQLKKSKNSNKSKQSIKFKRFQFTRALNDTELQRLLEICYVISETVQIQSSIDSKFLQILKSVNFQNNSLINQEEIAKK
ncbi:MAG: type ISP restriction/modification enzyme [Promethearchaeota archaeon]